VLFIEFLHFRYLPREEMYSRDRRLRNDVIVTGGWERIS
jgi:hypothetical protein